jgi:hypothetical protein
LSYYCPFIANFIMKLIQILILIIWPLGLQYCWIQVITVSVLAKIGTFLDIVYLCDPECYINLPWCGRSRSILLFSFITLAVWGFCPTPHSRLDDRAYILYLILLKLFYDSYFNGSTNSTTSNFNPKCHKYSDSSLSSIQLLIDLYWW